MFKKTLEPQEKSSAVMSSATRKAPEPQPRTSAVTPQAASEVTRDAIAKLAFQKWQKRGCPNGEDQRDWYEAERELKTSQSARPRRG